MLKKHDVATIVLGMILVVLLFTDQFMYMGESRVGAKHGLRAGECMGANYPIFLGLTIVLLIFILIKKENEILNFVTGMLASVCFGLAILFVGQAANVVELPSDKSRISISIGCYAYLVLVYIIEVKCNEYLKKGWQKFLVIGLGIIFGALVLVTGQLDGLSIMIEYYSRYRKFHDEFLAHIHMVLKVVLWGILLGVPLGWISFKKERVGKIISTILSTLESIPTIALICVLMFPLAFLNNTFPALKALGISGVGETPVFCALLCYALFQIVNSMYGALKVIDKRYIEIGYGMGMTTFQIFMKIELPLILPVLVSGIRVALISTILGTTIGAYAGYGGLGTFIIAGSRGFAIDLILLATLPIMAMIFFFDFILKKLANSFEYIRQAKGRVKV